MSERHLSVYVAGSTSDVERVNLIQEACRARGWSITFDWTGPDGEIRTDGSWDQHAEKGARIASREIEACQDADRTILLCPSAQRGLGCWIEMGATLAAGGEVWLVEPQRDSVFWQHPQVRRFASVAVLLAELSREPSS